MSTPPPPQESSAASCLPAPCPAGPGAQLEPAPPSSWPSLSPGGPQAEGEGGSSLLSSRLPGGRPRIPSPAGYHFVTATETATESGSPGWASGWPGTSALHSACFSYNHSRWRQQRAGTASPAPPSQRPQRGPGENGSLPLQRSS